MLISPPFLPATLPATEHELLEATMAWLEHGSFPVSRELGWHGGRHLQAIAQGSGHASVRCIADGTVVRRRDRALQAEAPALTYAGGYTSNGVVVVRHDTALGVNAQGEPVNLRFYSVYMHLHTIEHAVREGRTIHRKDPIGQAGNVYGRPDCLHFEICLDTDNLTRLVGRATGDVPLNRDGRTDALYGELHLRLPAGTPVYASRPPLGSASVPPNLQVLTQSGEDWFVGLRYGWSRGARAWGHATLTTRAADGRELANPHVEEDHGEYRLYARAQALSQAVRQANVAARRPGDPVPSPSACYELLRFGRVIGPDALTPADTPHWRQINTPAGLGWVNLNAQGVTKYSDADFPQWRGWTLVDDSQDRDSRCDSPMLRRLLDANGDGRITAQEAESRLRLPEVRDKLAKTICRFPSEWDAATVEQRWGWLRDASQTEQPLNAQQWQRFEEHARALCFDCPELFAAQWCFEPRAFIGHLKQCGWMSLNEMTQVLPRRARAYGIPTRPINWEDAQSRLTNGYPAPLTARPLTMPAGMHLALNKAFRKYGITTPRRQAHFFSQVFQETGLLTFNTEKGNDRYFRTMYEVITPQEAGEDYDNRGSVAWRLSLVYAGRGDQRRLLTREEYMVQRPQRVQEKAAELGNTQPGDGPRFKGRGVLQLTGRSNYALYASYRGRDYTTDGNQAVLATDAFVSADVSGFFWVSKLLTRAEGTNIHRRADAGSTDDHVSQVTRAVNGGQTHVTERREYFGYVWGLLCDAPTPADTEQLQRQTLPR